MKYTQQRFHTANIIESIKDWQDYRHSCVATYSNSRRQRIRTASDLQYVDWDVYNLHDYIFTHNTIVASVCHDPKDNHTITPGSVPSINANQNAWLNEVLGPPTNIYKTFVGAENFYEHVQDFRLSKGKVLDAVLRKVKNDAGEKVWYCFRGDVEVLMANGLRKKIVDIEPGEEVISGSGKIREVLAKSESFSDDLVEVKIRGVIDSFVCTSDHQVLAKTDINDEWKWTKASDLKRNDWVLQPKIELNQQDEDCKKVDEDFAWLMGFYAAEGSLVQRKRKDGSKYFSHTQLTISIDEKESVLDISKRVMDNIGPYKIPFFKSRWNNDENMIKSVYGAIDFRDKGNGSNVRIGHRILAQYCFDFCGRGSSKKRLSNEILLEWDQESKLHLLAGLIDGDGYQRRNVVGLKTTSNDLAKNVEFILNCLGWAYSTTGNWHKGPYSGCVTIELDCYSSEKLRPYLRFKNKFDNASEKIKYGNRASVSIDKGIARRVECVDSLSSNISIPVYNIEVEEDHSYTVSNITVKNCDILVATNRRHRDLVTRIARKELNTLSMGCLANITACSKCGKVMRTDWDACNCIRYEIGQPYMTPYGYESKVAELCGLSGNPESCKFIEASWVEAPAFKGAVVNHYISIPQARSIAANNVINIREAAKQLKNIDFNDVDTLRRVRVADKHSMTAIRLYISEIERFKRASRIKSIADKL